MPEEFKYALIGGGLASASAAAGIREHDAEGSIAIISAEKYYPYHRPPLSKGYLVEGDWEPSDVYHEDEDWYQEQNVTYRAGVRATGLDLDSRLVSLASDETIQYEKLLIATGAALIKLDVPGSQLEGLFYLRNIPDTEELIKASENAGEAVVVGGGFIGLELASSLRQRGMDVTLVYMEDRVWAQMLTPEIAHWLEAYYRGKGIGLKNGSQVTEFRGGDRVKSVSLGSGEALAAGMVAIGIGVRSDMSLVKGTALEGENGIPVNSYLESDAAGVYAAGDIAWYEDPLFNKRRRVEHFETAKGHGAVAGANMAGQREPYSELPYFFSDLFDLEFEFVGDFDLQPDRVDYTGQLSDDTFIARYSHGGQIFAAVFVGREEAEVEDVKAEIVAAWK